INILGNNKVESLFITVYQYLLRMMSRATPFGTFASLSDAILETTSDQNNIGEKSLENYKEYVRCATEYLFCIYDDVIFNLERFKEIKIHINPNIRKVENGIVFYIIGENPNYVEGKYVYYECSTKMNVML
ncbi:lantibiotic dehydratase, partial [Rhizobium leguminosarum]|uniref:lantibiotic dehydratase n=1 Tax=Rhizobium leguminosarum TaxID=384 RepID=UPI003F9AC916